MSDGKSSTTVRTRIRDAAAQLTASERKIANAILADYPFTGLESIQELAAKTGVSAPSVTRFVSKIGCSGFQDLQRQLIAELKEGQRSPLDLKTSQKPVGHSEFLSEYVTRISSVIQEMAATVSQAQFDILADLVADPSRNIFLLGGRVSDNVASFLSIHLRQIRSGIYHMADNPEFWPEHVLRMRRKDVVVLFDFRRYQLSLARLAETIAEARGATIVVVTDKWMSPAARSADHIVALPIDAGTAWDTVAAAIVLVEALIVRVSETDWEATQKRIRDWDGVRFSMPGYDQDTINGDDDET
ncbi:MULTISPECIES: MurR/RpiR family transcriptional regulator [Shinella]|jgi:DNA-binding MurR/RpiR family transcriptional regulator|uniref:MurR/RpiR family transcriptional regulator n=1 Tax=Shinella TaxID=323620 RepID=UPI001AC3CD33|nr:MULTISPECIES: MurR/RpiR family transcriptional regulator [Shinella]MBN9053197.1 MurR/RpiR family transcriptional regulator [Hyphomicrobiales bacterium]